MGEPSEHRTIEYLKRLVADHPAAINKFVAREFRHIDLAQDNDKRKEAEQRAADLQQKVSASIEAENRRAELTRYLSPSLAQKLSDPNQNMTSNLLNIIVQDHWQGIRLALLLTLPFLAGRLHLSLLYPLLLSLTLIWSIYHQRRRVAVHHALHQQSQSYQPDIVRQRFLRTALHADAVAGVSAASLAANSTDADEQNDTIKLATDTAKSINSPSNSEWLQIGAPLTELPSWVSFPPTEKVEWIQHTLAQLWPTLKVCVRDTTIASLKPILDANKPSFLTSITIAELDLGDRPPIINGIKFHPPLDDPAQAIVLDMDIRLANNPIVAIRAKAGVAAVKVELADLLVEASIRVMLTPLVSAWPCFSAMCISLVRKPNIQFRVETGDMNVMAIPGLNNWIYEFTGVTLASFAVYPRRIVVPILDVPAEKLKQLWSEAEPVGVVYVHLISCSDLHTSATHVGRIDPIAFVSISDHSLKKSGVMKNTRSPVFNFSCEFIVFDTVEDEVKIDLRNHDQTGSKTSMGDVVIPISALDLKHRTTSHLSLPLCHTTKGRGWIDLEVHFEAYKAEQRKELATSMHKSEELEAADDGSGEQGGVTQQAIALTKKTQQPISQSMDASSVDDVHKTMEKAEKKAKGSSQGILLVTIENIIVDRDALDSDAADGESEGGDALSDSDASTSSKQPATLHKQPSDLQRKDSKPNFLRSMSSALSGKHSRTSSGFDKSLSVWLSLTLAGKEVAKTSTIRGKDKVLKVQQKFDIQIPANASDNQLRVEVKHTKALSGSDVVGHFTIDLDATFNGQSGRHDAVYDVEDCTAPKVFPGGQVEMGMIYKSLS